MSALPSRHARVRVRDVLRRLATGRPGGTRRVVRQGALATGLLAGLAGAGGSAGALALTARSAPAGVISQAAHPSATLHATLTPKRLGHGTTIGLTVMIGGGSRLPPPLRTLSIRYPQSLGIALSGLGLDTCTAATLEAHGPAGCPPDSVMGHGSALGEIPFGPELIHEGAKVTIVRAQDRRGELALLFDAEGISPVEANIVLPALLEEARPPYGGRIAVSVPLIPSLPEAPDVAIASLHASIGPAGLTYYEHQEGGEVAYKPMGILLPKRCPRGGFPFAASLSFYNGARAQARARVRCPPGRKRARRGLRARVRAAGRAQRGTSRHLGGAATMGAAVEWVNGIAASALPALAGRRR